ncbi:MAG: hypothetical protein WDO16_14540 [Bacteroidota bacterium]
MIFSFASSDEPWEHHFEAGNYSPLKEMNAGTFSGYLHNKEFIKLAKMLPLAEWNNAGDLLLASFSSMIKWLAG